MAGEFDWEGWVARARAFVDSRRRTPGFQVLGGECRPRAWYIGLLLSRTPRSLRGLFGKGSAHFDLGYLFEYDPDDERETELFLELFPNETAIQGGPRLGPASRLASFRRQCREWPHWAPEERSVWGNAIPFMGLDNGDYLALAGGSDLSVLYLSHDERSWTLAPSLPDFLIAWERIAYLGPESWLLEPFLDREGHIDAEGIAARKLRDLLGTPDAK